MPASYPSQHLESQNRRQRNPLRFTQTLKRSRVGTQLIHHVTAATKKIADRKTSARLSYRVAILRKSLRRQNILSTTLRPR